MNNFKLFSALIAVFFSFSASAQWANGSLGFGGNAGGSGECPVAMIGNVTTGDGIVASSTQELCWGGWMVNANAGDIVNVRVKLKNIGSNDITSANVRLSNNGSATPTSFHSFSIDVNGNGVDSKHGNVAIMMSSPQTVTYLGYEYSYFDNSTDSVSNTWGATFSHPHHVGTVEVDDYGYLTFAFQIGSGSTSTPELPIDDLDVEQYDVNTTIPSYQLYQDNITAWEGCFEVEDNITSVDVTTSAYGNLLDYLDMTQINVNIYRNGQNISYPIANAFNGQMPALSIGNLQGGDEVCIKVYCNLDGCIDEAELYSLQSEELDYKVTLSGTHDGDFITQSLGWGNTIEPWLPSSEAVIDIENIEVDSLNASIEVTLEIQKDAFDVTSPWFQVRLFGPEVYQAGFHVQDFDGFLLNDFGNQITITLDMSDFYLLSGQSSLNELTPGQWMIEVSNLSYTICERSEDRTTFDVHELPISTTIRDIAESQDVRVTYTNNTITLNTTKSVEYALYDMSGRLLQSQAVFSQGTASLEQYSLGIYILNVKVEGDDAIYSQKFFKN